MTKPTLITNPRRVTVYLPELVAIRGREIAKQSGISLSQLMSDLLSGQAASISKVRIHADFPSDEFERILIIYLSLCWVSFVKLPANLKSITLPAFSLSSIRSRSSGTS